MRATLLITLIFICAKSSLAQDDPYRPLRITDVITLDGKLNEPAWQQASVMTDFMQTDPNPGDSARQKTEVRILYDDSYLYVGFRCYDDPKKLIRIRLERDYNLGDDDATSFAIDTYHDKYTGICFATNTLGARWDAQVLSDGQDQDVSYNTFWDVVTQVDSLGYCTEYRVPWSSLRFESRPEITMGFRAARLVRRTFELSTYPRCSPTITDGWDNISFGKEIVFENLKSKRPFYFIPYAIANYSMQQVLNEDGTGYEMQTQFLVRKNFVSNEALDKILSNIGADAKYGLSKNFTLDLTVNTDFAQAEVDDRIINLTKYDVNLPEKRQFFLESAHYLTFTFPSGNEMFTSRSIGNENGVIVPIIAGARVTGKTHGWQMGFLDMQTKGIEESSIAPHNFFVFRTRKDIDHLGSFVGGILTNRWNTDSSHTTNQTIGASILKRVNSQLSILGGAAGTLTDANFKNLGSGMYYSAGIYKNAVTGFNYGAGMDLVGKDCNPVMGYLDEPNHGFTSGYVGYNIEGRDKSKVEFYGSNLYAEYRWVLTSGARETFYSDFFSSMNFRSQANINFSLYQYKIDSLFDDWHLDDHNAIAKGTYKMFSETINLNAPQKSVYSASLSSTCGGFYGGIRFYISPDVSYSFNKHLQIGLHYEYNHISFDKYLDQDSSTVYQSHLIQLRIAYIFSTKFSLKLYTQFDNISHSISSNLRFRYNPKEGTDLYIVLNQGSNTNRYRLDPHLPLIDQQAVTVKFVKTFAL